MHNSVPTLQSVAALDASGKHDEAVDVLARATQVGDLKAMTMLGKRLLVGDRAPYLPRDGASLIVEAANKGEAEAIAQVAVLQCTGVYLAKSWSRSVETLTTAAQRGWKPARQQLLLLAGLPIEKVLSELDNPSEQYWGHTGKSVDLSVWFRVPPGETLHETPCVRRFANFIPKPISQYLIHQATSRLQPALVYDPVNRRNIRYKTRTNSIAQFTLVENSLLHFLLQEKMSAACGKPMIHMEATAILNYQPGEEISNHYDFVDPDLPNYADDIAENGQRVITFLIYLNDDYLGGETAFPELGFEHKGSAGEGLYFVNALADGSPDLRTLHAGKPPAAGEKWIVSQFVRDRPVKYVLD